MWLLSQDTIIAIETSLTRTLSHVDRSGGIRPEYGSYPQSWLPEPVVVTVPDRQKKEDDE